MKPIYYLSGPMSGMVNCNFPAFDAEAARMRALGHFVINPAELNTDPATSWVKCMRDDITALMQCTSIVMLPGFERSKGAMLELHIAERLEMTVHLAGELKGESHVHG